MWRPPAYLKPLGFINVRLADNFAAALQQAAELNLTVDNARSGKVAILPAASVIEQATARRVHHGTVEHLVELYRQSTRYAELSPGAKNKYKCAMGKLMRWAGPNMIEEIDEDDCAEWYEELDASGAREMARTTVRFALHLWRFGRKVKEVRELVRINPWEAVELRRLKRIIEPVLWSRDMIDRFVAAADALGLSGVGTAVLLNAWLGQRPGDVLRLDWSHYRQNRFRFVQHKTEQPMTLCDCPEVERRLEWELARRPDLLARVRRDNVVPTVIIINDRKGEAYGARGFHKQFNFIRSVAVRGSARLGLEPCAALAKAEFRWLRHTMVTDAAVAGLSTLLIASMSGHTEQNVERIIARYRIRIERMAQIAAERRLAAGGLFGVPQAALPALPTTAD
jgi:integrase